MQKDSELLRLSEHNAESQSRIFDLKGTAEKQRNKIIVLEKEIQELKRPTFVNDLICFDEPFHLASAPLRSKVNKKRVSFADDLVQSHASHQAHEQYGFSVENVQSSVSQTVPAVDGSEFEYTKLD